MDSENASPSAFIPAEASFFETTPVDTWSSSIKPPMACVVAQDELKGHLKKSSFRLSRQKKHREGKANEKIVPLDFPTPKLEDELVDTVPVDVPGSAKQPSVDKTRTSKLLKRELAGVGGFGLLGKEAPKNKPYQKCKRASKIISSSGAAAAYGPTSLLPSNPVFGVPLETAFERNPSHDGVVLPAFVRYCIDYIELHGLSTEGVYRVPGVNSQVQSIVAALDRGEEFHDIAHTLATSLDPAQDRNPWLPATHGLGPKAKACGYGHREMDYYDPDTRARNLPHEVYAVASVLKQFLRNLPEPVLTDRVGHLMESVPPNVPQMYLTLAKLVHIELPVSHRFLLAWLLQHINHIIDRSRENLMSMGNICIVLSPCLGISHRLLAVLLKPPPPDVTIDLSSLHPPTEETNAPANHPYAGHWLFPHRRYHLRPYHPPLIPAPDIELPESDDQIEEELSKQESVLIHLHDQIAKGETSKAKEELLWEVQRLVTELRRRKSLCSPESVRAELARQQAQLDRLLESITVEKCGVDDDSPKSPTRRRSHLSDVKHGMPDIPPHTPHCEELWELQRQVTMLKRRLKQQEKLSTPAGQSTAVIATGPDISSIGPSNNQIIISGGIPFEIPSVAELDQEEILNLTLRKVPIERPLINPPTCSMTDKPRKPVEDELGFTLVDHSVEVAVDALDEVIQYGESWVVEQPAEWPQSADAEANVSCNDHESAPLSLFVEDEESMEPSDHMPTDDEDGIKLDENQPIIGKASPDHALPDELLRPAIDRTSPPHKQLEHTSNHPPRPSKSPTATVQSQPVANQHTKQQLLYHMARKHELQAINADLCARIRSENAEIQRIQSCIDRLLERGGKGVRRSYEDHFATDNVEHKVPALPHSNQLPNGTLEHCSPWLNQSWVRMVDQLDAEDGFGDCGVGGDDEDSWLIGCPADEEEGDTSVSVTAASDNRDGADSSVISYTRLMDEEDEVVDRKAVDELENASFDFKSVNGGVEHNLREDYDEDEDDDDGGDEAELARTLHQLVLDNARLEKLNERYLEGIQAERNRCAELKVLLKLRNTAFDPNADAATAPVENTK